MSFLSTDNRQTGSPESQCRSSASSRRSDERDGLERSCQPTWARDGLRVEQVKGEQQALPNPEQQHRTPSLRHESPVSAEVRLISAAHRDVEA